MNLIIITSVIETPATPLSYSNIRSIYSPEERLIATEAMVGWIVKSVDEGLVLPAPVKISFGGREP